MDGEVSAITPLTELDKLRFQVLNARHRAAFMERENLVIQFLSTNAAAKQLTSQLQFLTTERTALLTQWCLERGLSASDYTVDEETGNFVKVSP